MRLPFHNYVKRFLIEAFSGREVSPAGVTRRLQRVLVRPCGKPEAEKFETWLRTRGITRLVHFTPLENVVAICQYGLLPREYLELEVIRLAIGSDFTDAHRREGLPHFNCLSITSPNYKMFYAKRCDRPERRWAVVDLSAGVLKTLFVSFTPTNAASGCLPVPGVEGADSLFGYPDVREQLELSPAEPTDPQAEALCDSIIRGDFIRSVYVANAGDAEWLRARRVDAKVDSTLFSPRRDWAYWRNKRVTDL